METCGDCKYCYEQNDYESIPFFGFLAGMMDNSRCSKLHSWVKSGNYRCSYFEKNKENELG